MELPKGTGGFLNPEKIIQEFELKEGMNVADFGCGHGYFTIPIAKLISEGKIWALDILPAALEAIKSRANIENLNNIRISRCDLEIAQGSKLKDESVDLVLVANLLFECENKKAVIKEAKRILKKKAKLIIIDWFPQSPLGPKRGSRVSPEDSLKLAKEEGFKLEKSFGAGEHHWGLMLTK